MTLTGPVLGALGACTLAVALLVWVLLAPRPAPLPLRRRRGETVAQPSALSRLSASAIRLAERAVGRRGADGTDLLDRAGLRMSLPEYVVVSAGLVLAAAAVGAVAGGPLAALALALLVGIGSRFNLTVRVGRRQRAFADQLEDSLQLMSSSLRAGHSMLQALNSVAAEAESPTSDEFTRVINEVRVGRPVVETLTETAERMDSKDFVWVSQAIAINREVGGNLAEVLDGVAATIRERNQIRRQVKSLSAEGTMSAYVLMALPLGITAFLSMTNPGYLARFTEGPIGWIMIGVCVLLMTVGAIWLRKVTKISF
ncbi:tight adherence protein B [Friedmanniella endophytica]|uniref:Tight adherence protein B n=1 Tax=Microlunatus kandeliicorticis TaxID=1759536 RepID=A0A7W3IPR9_9ACTN|nr:type II secretion system F family protein [Microlunatus kandeliicorticis]MBA8793007.1 tight adherence protein B [Microlunatus kandeliicorticis]